MVGGFTYDEDGKLLDKKQYIVATVIDDCKIGWSNNQKVKVGNSLIQKISDSSYKDKYPKLDNWIYISYAVPCGVIPPKKTSTGFLFACLGAGAVMNSLFGESSTKAVSKIREIST